MSTGLKRYRRTSIADAEYPHLKEDILGKWSLFDDAKKRIAELESELATMKADRDALAAELAKQPPRKTHFDNQECCPGCRYELEEVTKERDSLAAALDDQVNSLTATVARLTQERDAAVEEKVKAIKIMDGICGNCPYWSEECEESDNGECGVCDQACSRFDTCRLTYEQREKRIVQEQEKAENWRLEATLANERYEEARADRNAALARAEAAEDDVHVKIVRTIRELEEQNETLMADEIFQSVLSVVTIYAGVNIFRSVFMTVKKQAMCSRRPQNQRSPQPPSVLNAMQCAACGRNRGAMRKGESDMDSEMRKGLGILIGLAYAFFIFGTVAFVRFIMFGAN